jgi:hypothetical protein
VASAMGPGCVKTLRGITAPGILRLVVTLRAKKRKKFVLRSLLRQNQISFSHSLGHNRTQAAQRCFVASEQRPTVHGMRGAKILATNGSINRKRGTNLRHEANNGRRVYPHSGTGE